jgi:transposase-like protein
MQLSIEEMEAISKFAVNLSCAYCGQKHQVPIQLNRKNAFKCEGCKQTNGVFMQFTATTLTTPIESVKIPLPESESAEFKVSN